MKKIFILECVESERGWGQDYFKLVLPSLEEAKAKRTEINANNTSSSVPDFYIVANDIYEAVEDDEGNVLKGERVC